MIQSRGGLKETRERVGTCRVQPLRLAAQIYFFGGAAFAAASGDWISKQGPSGPFETARTPCLKPAQPLHLQIYLWLYVHSVAPTAVISIGFDVQNLHALTIMSRCAS